MNESLSLAVVSICQRYSLGTTESQMIELAVEYTEKSIHKLLAIIPELRSPSSNKGWTIPRCEKFCRDHGLSIEVQAFLEELCLWLLYGLPEFKDNMEYNAQSILREIKKYKSKK